MILELSTTESIGFAQHLQNMEVGFDMQYRPTESVLFSLKEIENDPVKLCNLKTYLRINYRIIV